jgi:hypothetical protein
MLLEVAGKPVEVAGEPVEVAVLRRLKIIYNFINLKQLYLNSLKLLQAGYGWKTSKLKIKL